MSSTKEYIRSAGTVVLPLVLFLMQVIASQQCGSERDELVLGSMHEFLEKDVRTSRADAWCDNAGQTKNESTV